MDMKKTKRGTRCQNHINLNANAGGEAREVRGVELKIGQHMEHLIIKWFLCLTEQSPCSIHTHIQPHTVHSCSSLPHLFYLMTLQYRKLLFVPVFTCVGISVSNERTKEHTRVFHLLVRMDGDVMAHWTIPPPSPSSRFCHPSIHHSSLLSSLPLQKLHLCKRYCRAQTLKAKRSEVDLHYGLCYERTSKGNTVHFELMELVAMTRGMIYVRWKDCSVLTAPYIHHQASDQSYCSLE